jgi:hypothetical protein
MARHFKQYIDKDGEIFTPGLVTLISELSRT